MAMRGLDIKAEWLSGVILPGRVMIVMENLGSARRAESRLVPREPVAPTMAILLMWFLPFTAIFCIVVVRTVRCQYVNMRYFVE
jgi:hypothetical protein